MKRKLLLALAVSAFALFAFAAVADDSSAAEICYDVNVYIQNGDGTYDRSVVDGVFSVRDLIETAAQMQGKALEVNSRGNISSVNGVESDDDHYWRIYQWLPLGTLGWGIQTFSDASDDDMRTGASYCLNLSTISSENGSVVYSLPTFQPVSTGYVFIRFANGFEPGNPLVEEAFTPEMRRDGFWLSGEGSSLGEVIYNAVTENGFDMEAFIGSSGGNDLSFWINSMFGLGDENLGQVDSGGIIWAYWSQWTWVDHMWTYNNWTLGYYDPGVYKYVECIYLISTPDPYGDDYVIDKGGPEPNPDEDEIVCVSNYHTVRFHLDGAVWCTQRIAWGQQPMLGGVPAPHAREGYYFSGWGDTAVAIYEDTDFYGSFIPVQSEKYTVSYYLHDGTTLLFTELVDPGASAAYAFRPERAEDQQYVYVFDRWSADLSSVTSDISVTPVYITQTKLYDVHFYDYNRAFICTRSTAYGTELSDLPDDPSRPSTVRYQYVFTSWSITPNGNSPADLSNVTRTLFVYAYYAPVARPYTVNFFDGATLIASKTLGYGTNIGNTIPVSLIPGYIVKMYRDPGLTSEYSTGYVIIGDTNIYLKKIGGTYDSERDGSGNIIGTDFTVTFDDTNIGNMEVAGGTAVLCDLSQYAPGTAATIGKDSLDRILREYGDISLTAVLPKGAITMHVSAMKAVIGDGDSIGFSIAKGPTNIKISASLKKLNYDNFYSVAIRTGSTTFTDLYTLGLSAQVSLFTDLDEAYPPSVWNITPKGATSSIPCSRSGNLVTFTSDFIQFFAVGTSDSGISIDVPQVVVPYGEVDFVNAGSGQEDGDPGTDDYNSTLVSMSLDNLGGVLFVPSSVRGYPLKSVSFAAFNSVSNASSVVIPCTVSSFSWESWSNTGIRDVYFLGDCPDFGGDIPSSVTVHYRPDRASAGWSAIPSAVGDLEIYLYDGAYNKYAFRYTYYIIDDCIVIHRYVSGSYVYIPDAIAVGGTERTVKYIGDAAFMRTDNPFLYALYGLEYTDYEMSEIEFGTTVTDIQTRAFYGSSVRNIYGMPPVVRYWDECFRDCRSLSNISVSDRALFIGWSAFRGCASKAFTVIGIPDSVRVLGDSAFYGCTNVVNISFGKGITAIPADCFGYCTSLCDLVLPETVRTIGYGAFYNVYCLQYVDLTYVESVDANAFGTGVPSRLQYVVLGGSLASLGNGAFGNCPSLTEIEAYCMMPGNMTQAFQNVDFGKVTFYVSEGVSDSWGIMSHVEIIRDSDGETPKDRTLTYVSLGMVGFFIVLGILSMVFRTKIR